MGLNPVTAGAVSNIACLKSFVATASNHRMAVSFAFSSLAMRKRGSDGTIRFPNVSTFYFDNGHRC